MLSSMCPEEVGVVKSLGKKWPNRVDFHQCEIVQLEGGGGEDEENEAQNRVVDYTRSTI